MNYDLVVIGCGAAGLSAAVAYADRAGRDARIAVLERATREGRGGATRWTSSWWRITSDRQLDPAFTETMRRVSGGKADLEYCRVFASEVPENIRFPRSARRAVGLFRSALREPEHRRRPRHARAGRRGHRGHARQG